MVDDRDALPRPAPQRPGRDRADRVTAQDRWALWFRRQRSRLLCRMGRHLWAHRRNPDVGGSRAHFQLCRRCGGERVGYLHAREVLGR